MEKKRLLALFGFLSASALVSTGSSSGKVEKLFVFGDSYADTGNTPPPSSKSWKPPYGITFPGKPSGRFSDGRVLTDYIASFLGIGSPLPYSQLKNLKPLLYDNCTQNGINFAHGGTGVFKTLVDLPNMTTQIDFLQQLLDKNLIVSSSSSMALVSLAGNDYATFLDKNNGSFQGLAEFSRSVINQLTLNLRRISGLGIKKIAVTGIVPLGCVPRNTASASYQNCDEGENKFAESSHNQLLKQSISRLNNETAAPGFLYLDLYGAFLSGLKLQQNAPGNIVASNQLRPCCAGVKGEDCGLVDMNGVKMYIVCPDPKQLFFWDVIHPTDAGWQAVYSVLAKESLPSFILP